MTDEQQEPLTDEQHAREMIRAVYDDGEAEINGRIYRFTRMTHKKRRRVFAFYTRVMRQVQQQDFSFLDSQEFAPVEEVLLSSVTYDGSLLSVLGDRHWDLYPQDYLSFVSTAMAVISFPFMPADGTDSG